MFVPIVPIIPRYNNEIKTCIRCGKELMNLEIIYCRECKYK